MAVADLGKHGHHLPDRRAVELRVGQLGPKLTVQSDQVQARLIEHPLDGTGGLAAGRCEAEGRVDLPGF